MGNDKKQRCSGSEYGEKRSIPPSKPIPKDPISKPTSPSTGKK